jgi:hypothetical protein
MSTTETCDYCGRTGTVVTERGEYLPSGLEIVRASDTHVCRGRLTFGKCPIRYWDTEAAREAGPDGLSHLDVAPDGDDTRITDAGPDGLGIYVHPNDRDDD